MICNYYQNDNLDNLPEKEQAEHLKSCPLCQQRSEFEDQIIREAGQLPALKPDAEVWHKIASSIPDNTKRRKNNIIQMWLRPKVWLSAAAVFLIMLSAVVFYFYGGSSNKVLSDGALVRVEFTEQNYMDAIHEMEQQATPIMAEMDTELMLLYRDKLETIDTQINRCREAIKKNPGNAHIRRYMLAALQDKKATLKEILDI
jgi:hypothetical protein